MKEFSLGISAPAFGAGLWAAHSLGKYCILVSLIFGWAVMAPAHADGPGICWDVRIQDHTVCDFSSQDGDDNYTPGGDDNYGPGGDVMYPIFENLGKFLENLFSRSHSRPPAHVRRANAFLKKAVELRDGGDHAISIDYFKKARAANPKGSTDWIDANIAWNQGRLADALFQQQNYVEAFEYLEAAAQLDRNEYGKYLVKFRRWAEIQQSMRDQNLEGRRIVRQALKERPDERSGDGGDDSKPAYDFDVRKADLLADIKRGHDIVGEEDEVTRDFFGIQGSPRKDLKIELLGENSRVDQVDEDDLITEPLRQTKAAKNQAARADAASKSRLKETAHREASKPFDRRATDVTDTSTLRQVLGISEGSVVDTRNIAERPISEGLRELPEWQAAAQRRERLNIEQSRQRNKLEVLEQRYNEDKEKMNRSEKGRLQVRIAVQKRATHKVEQQIAAVESEQERIYDSFASGMYEEGTDEQAASQGKKEDGAAPEQN